MQIIGLLIVIITLFAILQIWAISRGKRKYGIVKAELISALLAFVLPITLVVLLEIIFPRCITPDTTPTRDLMVGLWKPTVETIELIERSGYKETQQIIELKSDGTFMMTKMPRIWRSDFGKYTGKYENISGNWGIYDRVKGWIMLDLDVKNINSKEVSFTYAGCSICKIDGGYSLSFGIGDPDSGRNLVFTK